MEVDRYHFDTIGSTNSWAKEHASELDKNKMSVITASTQTGGYGRFKRKWVSPPGVNIYATFFFRIDAEHPDLINVPQVLSFSVMSLLEESGVDVKIKWPNDILIEGKKVSGFLCETSRYPSYTEVILGVGININMERDALDAIDKPATSLKVVTGKSWDVKEIISSLEERFCENLELFLEQGLSPFYLYLKDNLAFVEEPIRIEDSVAVWNGTLKDLNPDGSIAILLDDGTIKDLYSGEISC
ncbi:MAG: biotin--[acetyl-CoA-carboxylase] ligase [Waddliaceae bacterium]|nr:biotin--[acetyl-CoA-carboxylase] ligase [Waddliaceae bacterium]MBT3578374.1 biotin--[acetyl-CoA-carboxylase] ligase [Waddliaceae bacterium]MBT4444545.1 biotin--[acetyl-CoA-carboxylase] ligase [Waddliaceae bacterium]MBT6929109.1 biotin--[acetyl-CoA-carboxylase] ligase [Waddliaceae bacterium]MBT7264413.1 biotin--[acetyl-CoA-carboxylase] ligase [Waddliaceae bacterium]